MREKTKVMWAIEHVPSGSWNHGDAILTLYPFEHEAQRACVTEAFRPIRVVVAPLGTAADHQPWGQGKKK